MTKHLTLLLIIGLAWGQSGSGSLPNLLNNVSIMVGINQSFYGNNWKKFIDELENNNAELTQYSYRKLNLNLIGEFRNGMLGGE